MKTKSTFTRFVENFLLLLFLSSAFVTSGYALSTTTFSNYFYAFAGLLVLFSATKIILVGRFQVEKTNKIIIYIVILLLLTSFPSLLLNPSENNFLTWVKFIIVITYAAVFVLRYKIEDAAKMYVKMILILTCISLTVYVAINFGSVEISLPQFTNINGMLYKNGLVFFVYDNFLQWRNPGPFWEPGIFGSYLFVALVVNGIFLKKFYSFTTLILTLGLVSTMSAASFLLFGFFIMLLIVNHKNSSFILQYLIFLLLFLVITIFSIYISNILDFLIHFIPTVFSKFINDSLSVTDRISSPIVNIDIFLSKPISGYGLSGYLYEYVRITDSAQTSTSTAFLAAFGIAGFLYTLIWMVAIFLVKKLTFSTKIILIISILSILNKEPHIFFTLTYIMIFYIVKESSFNSISISHLRRQVLNSNSTYLVSRS